MTNETRYYELIKILAICFWITVVLVMGIVVVNPEEPLPIDHSLDAGRAAQVRAWTAWKAESGESEIRIVSIQSLACCMVCDGRTTCAALVECGGVACRGRDVKILLPCGALAFCGGEDE